MTDCELPYLLNYKNSLREHVLYFKTLEEITEIVKRIPRYDLLVNDAELLLLICRLIEIMIVKKNKKNKLDKKELCVDIYKNVFGNKDELFFAKLRSDIDFLHQRGSIKGINKWKKGFYDLKNYIKRWL